MKRFDMVVVLLCCLASISFGQQKVKSMYDGEKRIYYSSVKEAENKLLEYIQTHNTPVSYTHLRAHETL